MVRVTDGAPTAAKRRPALRLLLQWLIPVAILAAFIATGQLGQAIDALRDVSLIWAIPLVVAGVLLPISHAWRWCFLLQRVGECMPVLASARITALASLLNYAAPGFLGAPAKAVFAREGNDIPISRSLPTLVVEQILDALMLAIVGALALMLIGPVVLDAVPASPSIQQVIWFVLASVVVLLIAAAAWVIARRFLPGFVSAVSSATRALLESRLHRTPIAALTVTRWTLDMLAVAIASIAVGLRLSLVEILLLANISLLIGLVAPVPGGLGVREAVMAGIAGVIGISIPAVLALSVLHRAGLAIGLPIVLAGARLREWGAR